MGDICAVLNELVITTPVRAALVRLAELATSRMSRAAAERAVARLSGPLSRAAKGLGYELKLEVHGAHHYFPRYGQRLEHIQATAWKAGVKGSHKIIRFVINLP